MYQGIKLGLKRAIKQLLEKWNLYWFLRNSILYNLYLRVQKPSYLKLQKDSFEFYSQMIERQKKLIIFNIGANCGGLTEIFSKLGAKVISVEPDKQGYHTLCSRFRYDKKVFIINKAVSNKKSVEKFYVTEEGSVYNTLCKKWVDILGDDKTNAWGLKLDFSSPYDVETTTLDALILRFGLPYYIKIDVEGYELNVIRSLSYSVPFLSFETHLPEFAEEAVACLYYLYSINTSSRFNYYIEHKFGLRHFLDINEFIAFLSKTKLRYMEIYCKTPEH